MDIVDVVIIGAGVAGLACAQSLARKGLKVVVLEARDRVGGRISSLRLDSEEPIELGAQVVHGRWVATWDILREAGIATFLLPRSSEFLIATAGRHRSVSEPGLSVIPPWEAAQILRAANVGDVPLTAALSRLGHDDASRNATAEWLAQVWAGDPDHLSAAGIAAGQPPSGVTGDEYVIVPGYIEVASWLAIGVDIRFRRPVSSICWRPGRVELAANGLTVRARAVVISVPPSVVASGNLRFVPRLPVRKEDAAVGLRLGDGIVVAAELSVPAPRSTHVLAVDRRYGLWRATAGSFVVLGAAKGLAAPHLRDAAQKPERLDAILAYVLPWYRPGWLVRRYVADWGTDPCSLGTYTYPLVGKLDLPAIWALPVCSTLFFAGEATCGAGDTGMVHGALESGRRAAAEVAEVVGC